MQPGRTGLAVCMMVAAAFLNSLDAVIVRLLAGEVHPLMIGFFRFEMPGLNAGAFWYHQRFMSTPTYCHAEVFQRLAKTGDAFHRSVFQSDGEKPASSAHLFLCKFVLRKVFIKREKNFFYPWMSL